MDSPRKPSPLVYVGIASSVVALRKDDGRIEWSTRLKKTTTLVSLMVEDGRVYALASGEISCLDARNGELLWHNELKGFGRGWAILAGAGHDVAGAAAVTQAQAAQAAAAASVIAASSAASAAAH